MYAGVGYDPYICLPSFETLYPGDTAGVVDAIEQRFIQVPYL